MELQWPLIIFTTLIAWSAGLFGAQGLAAILKRETKAQMAALITSVVIMAIGGIAVFMHLQHWERIFNGFGHLSSGITQELIGIVAMACVMVVMFALIRRNGGRKLPVWLGILALVVAIALVFVMGHSYMMAARPAWDNYLQIASLMGASCILGPATFALIVKLADPENAADFTLMTMIGSVVNLVCTCAYVYVMGAAANDYTSIGYYYDPTQIVRGMIDFEAVSGLFTGSHMYLTIGTIACVVLAVIAAVLLWVNRGKADKAMLQKVLLIVIIVLAVAAAVLLRVLFYELGLSVFMFYME